jgi:hypothetical protein
MVDIAGITRIRRVCDDIRSTANTRRVRRIRTSHTGIRGAVGIGTWSGMSQDFSNYRNRDIFYEKIHMENYIWQANK